MRTDRNEEPEQAAPTAPSAGAPEAPGSPAGYAEERIGWIESLAEKWADLAAAIGSRARATARSFGHKHPSLCASGNRAKGFVQTCASRAAQAYASMSWARAAILTVFLVTVLFTIDSMTGHLPAYTLIYMLPIWLAARLAGAGAGIFAMGLVGLLMGVTSAGGVPASQDEAVVSFAIRWIGLGAFLISVLHVENSLRSARQQATHDPLTGLVNRGAIETMAAAAIERGESGQVHVAVIDCDRFKALNDANGHAFGDHALRVAARRLEAAIRDKGQVGRLGGDEFVVLFDGATPREARASLEKANNGYRRMLASLGWPAGLSYGLATCGKDGATFDQLCRVADERMYSRKRSRAAKAAVLMPDGASEPSAESSAA